MKNNDSQTGSIADESASTGRVVDRARGGSLDRDSNAGDGRSVTLSEPMPTAQSKRDLGVDRRTFLKGIGASAAVAVGVSHPRGFVQESEAAVPLVVAGVIGASIALDWGLREAGIRGADPPPEGLTPDGLKNQTYQSATARQSENRSTIVDNGNILDGVQHTAYTEAKIAAIEQLNAGVPESEVLASATTALDDYETTVRSNYLKSWNESVRELQQMKSSLDSHPDLHWDDVMRPDGQTGGGGSDYPRFTITTASHDLPDGSTMDLLQLGGGNANTDYEWNWSIDWDATEIISSSAGASTDVSPEKANIEVRYDGKTVNYLVANNWNPIWTEMNTVFENVRNGIALWVSNVYGEVQSGEIEVSELVTPRERAAMMAEGEGTSQAIADLIALNIPVDLEREATVFVAETGTTFRGTLALTDSADGPIEAGTTYDAATFAGDIYLTTDLSLLEGEWSAFNAPVDGGTITLSSEPYEGMVYSVETTAGETVSVPASDWSDNGDGTWSYDASGSLETTITEVSAVSYYSESETTQYETINLDGSFTVETFTNTETGEEDTSATFSNTEPQDDTNYITQEEWNSLEQQNQELIDKFEESQNDGGGGWGGIPWGDFSGAGGAGALAVGVALSVAVVAGLKQVISFYIPGK